MDLNKIKEQFNLCAQEYDDHRRCFIPCFNDFYKNSVSLLKCYKSNFETIVDLGAGTGLLTMEIYKLYNNAHYMLIDVSNAMLTIAKERFAELSNFEFVEKNYVEGIPVANCDLICSALSIHHLENTDKLKLYNHIYNTLDKGGCFINLDQFVGTSEEINSLYNEWWSDYIDSSGIKPEEKSAWIERRKLDRENTIQETMELLKESGFKHIECIYNFMKFGVIMAIK
jgi:ubiquinone/menaquinone biosynthesis C-methylase UbiE